MTDLHYYFDIGAFFNCGVDGTLDEDFYIAGSTKER